MRETFLIRVYAGTEEFETHPVPGFYAWDVHCAADGVYEAFLVSAPLNAPGGIGSPANAVAIK